MEESPEKKKARRVAVIVTFLYLMLFFPSFYVGFLGFHVTANPNISGTTGTTLVFMSLFVPFSLIFSIFLLWAMYFKGWFQAMYISCFLPLAITMMMLVGMSLLVH